MKVIAFVNQKGGTGKTTACVNISAGLAFKGKKVLLIDLDPQANATLSLGIEPEPLALDMIIGKANIKDLIQKTSRQGLEILPGSEDLALATIELEGKQDKLKKAIAPLSNEYDYIMIDCPPALNLLTINALTTSQGLIIPVLATYLSLEGLKRLLSTINMVRENLNPGLEITGILPNMIDPRRILTVNVLETLRNKFKGKVFKTIIPVCVALAESQSHGLDVFAYESWSTGAIAYRKLAEEILKW